MTSVDTPQVADIWFASLAYPTGARLEMIRQHYLTPINDMIVEQPRSESARQAVAARWERYREKLAREKSKIT